MTQVVFSELAELGVEEIGDYIAGDKPLRGVSLTREIPRTLHEYRFKIFRADRKATAASTRRRQC